MSTFKLFLALILMRILPMVQSAETNEMKSINILFIHEESNFVAKNAYDAVANYVNGSNQSDMEVHLESIVLNDASDQLEETLCKTYDALILAKRPPHLILDTTQRGDISTKMKQFSKKMEVPTISTSFDEKTESRHWRNLDENQQQYLIKIEPPADTILNLVHDWLIILAKSKWENTLKTAILYDSTFSMDQGYINMPMKNTGIPFLLLEIPKVTVEFMDNLRNELIYNIFIFGNISNINKVLKIACKSQYLHYYNLEAFTQEEEGQLYSECRSMNITIYRPMIANELYEKQNQLIRAKYNLTTGNRLLASFYFDLSILAINAVNEALVDDTNIWPTLNLCENSGQDGGNNTSTKIDLIQYLEQYNSIAPSYAPIIMNSNRSIKSYMDFNMNATYIQIRNSKERNSLYLGTLPNLNSNVSQRYSERYIYRVVVAVQEPFVFHDPTSPKKFSGYCIDIMDAFAEENYIKYEIYEVPDKMFGDIDQNGNWNGLVKELLEKRADIALGSISVTIERENVIDFSVPYYEDVGIAILMSQPQTSTSLFKILTVIEGKVWIGILIIYLISSCLIWIFTRWSPASSSELEATQSAVRDFNFKECLWFCMTSLTPQGGGEAPRNLPSRLIAATWWLFGFIIIASYSANITAFMTVSKLDAPIESLEDLSEQYKIQYAPLNDSSAMTYFERMKDIERRFYKIWKDMTLNDSSNHVDQAKLAVWEYPVSQKYTKIWKAIQEARPPNTLEEAVQRVRASPSSSEGFAYLGDGTDLKFLKMTNCDLQIVGQEFSKKPYALAMSQGSRLISSFNYFIIDQINTQQLERYKEKWWSQNPKVVECEKNDEYSEGIHFQNVGGIFIVSFVGIATVCIYMAYNYFNIKKTSSSSMNIKVIMVQEGSIEIRSLPKPLSQELSFKLTKRSKMGKN